MGTYQHPRESVIDELRNLLPLDRRSPDYPYDVSIEVKYMQGDREIVLIIPPKPREKCPQQEPYPRDASRPVGPPDAWCCECSGVIRWGSARNGCDHPAALGLRALEAASRA